MNVLDLFSGIGGFSLGLERAGMHTIAFCECDPYCQRVLRKHWSDVPVFGDVRTLSAEALAYTFGQGQLQSQGSLSEERGWPSVICGGFPCQDISVAGKGAGLDGERSGLWVEFARIIGDVRPRYVIIENVSALLGRGLVRILCDLTALGYVGEWHCIGAVHVGAPHRRDRVWIIAYPNSGRCEKHHAEQRRLPISDASGDVANANGAGQCEQWRGLPIREELAAAQCNGWWRVEPNVGRVAHGVPSRVDRLRGLGNAIVPQIAEIIGKAILKFESRDA
jgi:DNA (cytosine-5)-methyltransferase 1